MISTPPRQRRLFQDFVLDSNNTPLPAPSFVRQSPPSAAANNDQTSPDLRQTLEQLRQDENQRLRGRIINAVTHTNTITTVYKDGRTPEIRRISTRTSGGRTVARRRRGRGRRTVISINIILIGCVIANITCNSNGHD